MTGSSFLVVALVLATTAATSVAMPHFIATAARHGLTDRASARSAHVEDTPRGAGIVVVTVFAAAALSYCAVVGAAIEAWATVGGTTLVALIGFVEDVRGLSVASRLLLVAACGLAVSPFLASSTMTAAAVVLLLVYLTNTANFMDGINGLSVAQAFASSLGLVGLALAVDLPVAALVACLLAASFLGFARDNVPTARAFLGDVGSYALGAFFCFEACWLVAAGVRPAPLLLLLVIPLFDVSSTLLARARRGEDLRQPHNQHVYQQLARNVGRHWPVSALVLLLGLLASGTGVLAQRMASSAAANTLCLLVGAALVAAYMAVLHQSAVRGTSRQHSEPRA